MPDVSLSVVCPIYNCEKYVGALIDSLVAAANSQEIEFLFIEDGSSDASLSRCQEALKLHERDIRFRHRVLSHEQNRGLSAARNTGIRASCGRYIGFLDGDDVLLPGYSEHILSCLSDADGGRSPDVIGFSYSEFRQYEQLASGADRAGSGGSRRFDGSKRYKTLFQHGFFVWSRIYRRELVESVMFVEDGRAYEDIAFSMDVLARAREVLRLEVPLVGYRKSGESITAVRDRRFFDQFMHLSEGMKRNRDKFGGGLTLEGRYLFKLFIVLLKAMKIRPASDRLDFYRSASAHMHSGDSVWSKMSMAASRGFSSVLLFMFRALRLS